MPVFLLYLLQSSVCLLAFYLLYLGFLKRLTFFTWSRFYLVAALLLSLLIPQLKFSVAVAVQEAPALMAPFRDIPVGITPGAFENEPVIVPAAVQGFSLAFYCWFIYIAGVVLVSSRILAGFFRLWQLMRRSEKFRADDCVVVLTNGVNASFFHYIFIDRKAFTGDDRAHILLHEKAHVQLRHSADLLLLELVSVICWFNPVVWLYRKSVKEVHEFQADKLVAGETDVKTYAGILLKLATAGRSIPVHTFSRQPLKGRIKMLFTNPSHKMKKLLFILALPVTGALLYSFSIERKPVAIPTKANELPFVLVLDAGHGGTDAGASSRNKHEKDLTLLLTQEIGAQAKAAGLEVVYTRSGDELLTPQDRIAAVQDRNVSLFLSVHIGASNKASDSGSDIYMANNGKWFPASKKAALMVYQQLKDASGLPVTAPPTVREKDIYVLKNAQSAAMLLSVGYLNNPGNVKLLEDAAWRREFAGKVIKALQYFKEDGSAGMNKKMHEKMGLPEQTTHIWQLDRGKIGAAAEGNDEDC